MNYKKILISVIALVAVFAVVYAVWRWQSEIANRPIRQEQEIR